MGETEEILLTREIIKPANQEESDKYEMILWMKDKLTGEKTKILTAIPPDWACWYMSDGTEFVPVPIDSIFPFSRVFIFRSEPLQIIVEGCPDSRNEFSYFVDVPSRKAWYVPANNGYMGGTEEGYMVFRSYRYVSDPDIAGRYTFLQIFNDKGTMVDSLDLEHVKLEASN